MKRRLSSPGFSRIVYTFSTHCIFMVTCLDIHVEKDLLNNSDRTCVQGMHEEALVSLHYH